MWVKIKNLLAKAILFINDHIFTIVCSVVYVFISIAMIWAIAWTGFFIWLTITVLIGIVLLKDRAVKWAMNRISDSNKKEDKPNEL